MALPIDDMLAIHALLAEYNHLIDGGEAERWARLFVEDGSLDTGMAEPTVGRDALTEFAKVTVELVAGIRHLVSNVVVEGDIDDATTRCYLQVWQAKAPASDSVMVMSGVYRDTLRRVDGQWRFVTRRLTPDTAGPIAGS